MSFTKQKVLSALPATERGRAVLLGDDPKEGKRVVYCNGRTVIIRDLADPGAGVEYTQHSSNTTVARISPSGYYVASSDVQGNVRIWDATQPEQILKLQVSAIGGKINDLSWDGDSQRIIAVGEGRERFGRAFTYDSGNTVGEIMGHSKTVNSCHIRANRPYRAVTAGDDNIVCFFHGPPYRFQFSIKDHTRFVNCVRFSPNGDHFASVGADGKLFLYNGASGERVADLSDSAGSDAHKGGIYSLAWKPDSTQILTSSADGSAKIWDIASSKVVNTFQFAQQSNAGHQQVGNIWQGDYLVSLSLSGELNCLDPRVPEKPARIIGGHQSAITGLASDGGKTLWSSSYEGRVYILDMSEMTNRLDEQLRTIPDGSDTYTEKIIAVNGAPKQLSASALLRRDHDMVDQLNDSNLPAEAVSITLDGKRVAVGHQARKLVVYDTSSHKAIITQWVSHTSRITSIAWSPDGKHVATGALDTNVYVWSVASPNQRIPILGAHASEASAAQFIDDSTLATAGRDATIKVWKLQYHT
ncbi:WD40-repeat-containing domain protein [Syncephalis plumigaleata]|nr:WD40-repeat-containing domain protein [Syncephalis plumigaleata]